MSLEAYPRTKTQTVFFVLMSALALASLLFSCQALYLERHRITSGYGDYVIFYTGAQIVSTVASDAVVGSRVAATIRPTAVRVSFEPSAEGGANRFTAAILDLEPRGDIIRVRSDIISADLTPTAVADAQITTGMSVEFVFAPEAVTIYAADAPHESRTDVRSDNA